MSNTSWFCYEGRHTKCAGVPDCTCVCHEKKEDTVSEMKDDPVNHPTHYTSDPSGVECITIVRHRNFNVGNAIKYLWRAGLKKGTSDPLSKQIEDLEKARWYIADEIERLRGGSRQEIFRENWAKFGEEETLYKKAQGALKNYRQNAPEEDKA